MINPYVIMGVMVALIASGTGGFWWGAKAERNAIEAQEARDAKVRAEVEAAAQLGAAKAISAIEVKNVVVNQKLQTEIREKPVYRECVADGRVFDLTNEAITGAESARDRELPATVTHDRPDVR